MRSSLFILVIFFVCCMVHAFEFIPFGEKQNWPETVGMTAEKATEIIQSECEGCKIRVMKEHTPATMDFRMNRVRIVVNENDEVVAAPARG